MGYKSLRLVALAILSSLCGCNKEDQDLRDFYLSQPRDFNLIGTWVSVSQSSTSEIYKEDGYIYVCSELMNGEIYSKKGDCWYTIGDSILKRYTYTDSHLYGSVEYPAKYYKIEGDSLYLSDSNIFKVSPNYKRNNK